jgi:ribonucleoside-triphosphate reductase
MRRNEAVAVENANANVDENSFSGREKEASSDIQKIIALDYTLSPEVGNAHKNMLLYQHDLEKTNIGMHNCLHVDFKKLFTDGFKTRNGDIRPPSSFSTACQQVAVIFQFQSQVQFGGVGTVHLDYDLAPFVKKSFYKHIKNYLTDVKYYNDEDADKALNDFEEKHGEICIDNTELTSLSNGFSEAYNYAMKQLEREGKQSAEALYHNLNTLESRAGSQVPFTSINFGRDLSTEGKLVQKWMMNASLAGVGKHHLTPIFPISIYQYKSGVNAEPGTPGYDMKQLAIESLSKRIYPNFVNCDYSQAHEAPNNPDTFYSTMGK